MAPLAKWFNIRGLFIKIRDFIVKGVKGFIGIFQIPPSTTMDPAERKLKIWEVVVKGAIGVLVAGVVTIIGFTVDSNQKELAQREESKRAKLAEENRALTAMKDLSAKQKEMDLTLGIQMFQTLMSNYLKVSGSQEANANKEQQLLLLRLISSNFQDSPINIKPLFEDLDSRLTGPQEKQRLREIAMDVARRQAFRLTLENGLIIDRKEPFKKGDSLVISLPPATITIDEVGEDAIRATITPESPLEEKKTLGPFSVNFFATPLLDNTKLFDKRVSLLLLKIEGEEAKVRVVIFDSYLAQDRFDIKESSHSFRFNDYGEKNYTGKKSNAPGADSNSGNLFQRLIHLLPFFHPPG